MTAEILRLDPGLALPAAFYDRPVTSVARDLIGATLVSEQAGTLVAGRIVETEAYGDERDPASHASFRKNGLVRAMWGAPGTLYVYTAYGLYPCFNAVTGPKGEAGAVLIRALEILHPEFDCGQRSGVASGPGRVGRAIALTVSANGASLRQRPIWVQGGEFTCEIVTAPRVGVRRGTEVHWRFAVLGHHAVSRPRPW
jgi:DNA-3-methyladenine glycosylase